VNIIKMNSLPPW